MSANLEAVGAFFAAIALLAIIGFFVFIGAQIVVGSTTDSRCLALGYAESRVDFKFNRYCVVRDYRGVMQSIPLDEAKKQP